MNLNLTIIHGLRRNKLEVVSMNKEDNKKEVLNETFKIIRRKPSILLPMVILVLFSRLQDYLARSYIDIPDNIRSIEDLMPVLPSILAYFLISSILLCIIYAIIEGIYTVTCLLYTSP